MIERDILVALVAFGLGGFLVHAAWISRPKCFEFWLVKRIEARYGRTAARNFVGLVGGLLIALGVFVLLFPSSSHRSRNPQSLLDSSSGHESGVWQLRV
jgi:hypothetical protein